MQNTTMVVREGVWEMADTKKIKFKRVDRWKRIKLIINGVTRIFLGYILMVSEMIEMLNWHNIPC